VKRARVMLDISDEISLKKVMLTTGKQKKIEK
jgi:hypothetical protein